MATGIGRGRLGLGLAQRVATGELRSPTASGMPITREEADEMVRAARAANASRQLNRMADFASPLVVRVGIVGAASIAKKNARAIQRSERCALVAVASRTMAKAEAWVAELGFGASCRCVEGYEHLLAAADVDAVYVPLPTSLHLDFVVKAAAAGKHVLVEKPVGRTAAEVRAMVDACRAAGVALLDGTMFVHHARFEQMDRLFADEQFWAPTRVSSAFTFWGDEAARARVPERFRRPRPTEVTNSRSFFFPQMIDSE